MASVSSNTTIVRFHFPGDVAAAGLFVLWRIVPQPDEGVEADAELEDYALGFCGFEGTLHDVLDGKNPWPLALRKDNGLSARLGTPPIKWQELPYEIVLVSHPSAIQAKALLDRLRSGRSPDDTSTDLTEWRRRTVTPVKSGKTLRVELPDTPGNYVPRGHDAFNGWTLYRRMPYAGISDVKEQVKKLAFKLGQLRYPTALLRNLNPYPESEAEHDGVFDTTLQSCLRRYQIAVNLAVAFQLSPEGVARRGPGRTERETWAHLHGTSVGLPPRELVPAPTAPELDVVDNALGAEILRWEADGLRNPGNIVTSVEETPGRFFFAEPRLWMAYRALILTARALGMLYPTLTISRTRGLKASAPGQVELSFHKLGRAVDIDTLFDEPSPAVPLAFEADFVKKTELQWKLYVHSRLDPLNSSVEINGALAAARKALEDELVARLGTPLPLVVRSYLLEVDTFYARLNALAATPAASGGTQLGADFFRATVARFQYQPGSPNLGAAQPAVGATEDAAANGVGGAAGARSWLNLTRVAFHLGLVRIDAQDLKHGPTAADLNQAGALTTIVPRVGAIGGVTGELGKGATMDSLVDGIRAAAASGETSIRVIIGTSKLSIPIADLDLVAMRNWVRRASDAPGTLRLSPKGAKFESTGVDLTFEVHFAQAPARQELIEFLNQRAAIQVKVLRVGDGVNFNGLVSVGAELAVGDLLAAVTSATPIAGKKDHTVGVRPIFARQLKDVDPGGVSYEVPKMHSPSKLEWWHLQLQPPGDAENWFDFAEDFGLDTVSMLASTVPSFDVIPSASNPVPWMGGEKEKESRVPFPLKRSKEPDNLPGKPPP